MMKSNKSFFVSILFSLIFLFEASFGLYYAFSEWNKKGYEAGFDPSSNGLNYILSPNNNPLAFNDLAAYNKLAYSLIEKGGFYNPANEPSAWVLPGFPIILAILYSVFGYSFWPVLILNALCVTFAYYFLYKIARNIWGNTAANITLFLLVVNIRVSYHLGSVLTEPLFFFLICSTLYLAYKILSGQNTKTSIFILLGVVVGYGALVRPVIVPMLLVFIPFFLKNKIPLPKIVLVCALSGLIFSTWIIRNYNVFGRFLITTNSEMAAASIDYDAYKNDAFFAPYTLHLKSPRYPGMVEKAIRLGEKDTMFMESTSYLYSIPVQQWKAQHKQEYLYFCVQNIKALLSPYTSSMSPRNKLLSSIIWSFTFLPAFLSLFLPKGKWYWLIFLSGISLMMLPALVGVDLYLRYQLPLQLFFTILAGYFFCYLYKKLRSRIGEKSGQPLIVAN